MTHKRNRRKCEKILTCPSLTRYKGVKNHTTRKEEELLAHH